MTRPENQHTISSARAIQWLANAMHGEQARSKRNMALRWLLLVMLLLVGKLHADQTREPNSPPSPSAGPYEKVMFAPRRAGAPTGSAFFRQIESLPSQEREAAMLKEITRGNVPDFLRSLQAIEVTAADAQGAKRVANYYVTPDYLAVGTDDDFFRLPMTPMTAQAIADAVSASLITAKISDDIFQRADLKLQPQPLTKDRESATTFFQHHQLIEEQRKGKRLGLLVVGIKKDVVLTNRLKEKPHRVAIYGWHYPDGRPIQPLYVGHVDTYVDYSHGIRLMSRRLIVDGRPTTVEEVLKDPHLSPLLSNEGPIEIGYK
jgi:hypothetical protein